MQPVDSTVPGKTGHGTRGKKGLVGERVVKKNDE
jgi:hypothetical protein